MKKNINFTIFLYAAASIIICMGCGRNMDKQTDSMFAMYSGNVPGAAVRIIQGDSIVLTKTYGLADPEKQIPVTSKTNFRLASVTKQFTAMCIMILHERGKLHYTTTLRDIWPEFPEYGADITIHQILKHVSGLQDYESIMPDTATVQVHDEDVLQMMKSADSTYFEPGSDYSYSNSGYAVLVRVIEEISGSTFPDFLRDNIFEPLGMQNTVAFVKGVNEIPHRAFGYKVEGDSIQFKDQSPTSAVLGDGGIYSSIDDLVKWFDALKYNELVSEETLARAFTPGRETYGYGWRIDDYGGHRRVHHTGSTSGFRNVVQHFPDDALTIIILTNRAGPDVAHFAEKLADMYLEDKD